MSVRMLQKVLREQQQLTLSSPSNVNGCSDAEDSHDCEPFSGRPVSGNPFDLLDTQDDAQEVNDDACNQDDTPQYFTGEEESHTAALVVKGKNKKKKTKKNKGKRSSFEPNSSNESVDLLLERLAVTETECASHHESLDSHSEKQDFNHGFPPLANRQCGNKHVLQKKYSSQILSVDPKFLKAEDELRRIFGSKVISSCENNNNGGNLRRKQGLRRGTRNCHVRKTILVVPSDYWPRWDACISMDHVESKDGLHFFRYTHSSSYTVAKQKFEAARSMYDINGIAHVLVQHPYHVESLLALAEAFKYSGDHQRSVDAIERCLYGLECAWHPLFNPLYGNCKLDYSCDSNKPFFSALLCHMQNLDRRGCHRSALEVCKLLLSLDSDDPAGALFCIDYFALRAEQYEWLELFADRYGSDNSLWLFPNFSFSLAVARFYLEHNLSTKETPVQTDPVPSSDLLKQALMLHPLVLKKIVDRAPLKDTAWTQILKHPHFAYAEAGGPSLTHLIQIYVERNYLIWRLPELQKWLKDSAFNVIQTVDEDKSEAKDWACVRKEAFQSDKNEYMHLSISDFSDSLPTIPPEEIRYMMLGRAGLDAQEDALGVQYNQQGGLEDIQNRNPMLMILQTFFPWVDYGSNINANEPREVMDPGEEN